MAVWSQCITIEIWKIVSKAHIGHPGKKTTVLGLHNVKFTLALKNWTTFKYRIEFWLLDVCKFGIQTTVYILENMLFHYFRAYFKYT